VITTAQPNLPTLAAGLRRGLPAAEYHRLEAASASRLNCIRRQSPRHMRYRADNPMEPTPALVVGSAAHCLILEPETFERWYVVASQCSAVTKAGKRCGNAGRARVADGWLCGVHLGDNRPERSDVTILSADDMATVEAIRDAVRGHPTAGKLLARRTDAELSATWTDAATGCPCKARLDAPLFADRSIVDLKTTDDAGPDSFARSILNYGYDLQARHYVEAARANDVDVVHFWIVAVEKAPPHAVGVYRLTERNLQAIDATWRGLLKTYAGCHGSGVWPAYPDVSDIEVPEFGLRKLEAV
jgi:hypothetical protein